MPAIKFEDQLMNVFKFAASRVFDKHLKRFHNVPFCGCVQCAGSFTASRKARSIKWHTHGTECQAESTRGCWAEQRSQIRSKRHLDGKIYGREAEDELDTANSDFQPSLSSTSQAQEVDGVLLADKEPGLPAGVIVLNIVWMSCNMVKQYSKMSRKIAKDKSSIAAQR